MEVVVLSVTKEDQTADNVDESWCHEVSSINFYRGSVCGGDGIRIADGFLPK